MDMLWLDLSRDIFHYKFTAILLLFRFAYIFLLRKRSKLLRKRAPRPSSDATWFLPVYFWGIESLFHLLQWLANFGWWWKANISQEVRVSDPGMDRIHPSFFEHGFFSAAVLIGVVGFCYLQEQLARRIGLGVRESQATIPLAVIVSILGVWFMWISYISLLTSNLFQ